MKKKTSIIVCATALLLSCLFIFTSVDKKICDLFMMTNKNIKENEKVVLVNIDDSSIEKLGSFPWTRDIYAETVLVLRELGAKNIVLDSKTCFDCRESGSTLSMKVHINH